MTANLNELRDRQAKAEDTFRAHSAGHLALVLIDGCLNITPAQARTVEQHYTMQAALIQKARGIAHARAGQDFSTLLTMATNAAVRACPFGDPDWSTTDTFRFGAAIDSALWAVLAKDVLQQPEYDALVRAAATAIPALKIDIKTLKEANVTAAVQEPTTEAVTEAVASPVEAATEAISETPSEVDRVQGATEKVKTAVAARAVADAPQTKSNAFVDSAQATADANPGLYADFTKSKMGYVGGAFSYTCEKVIKESGNEQFVGRGQRTLAAFAIFCALVASGDVRLAKIKIASKWWADKSVQSTTVPVPVTAATAEADEF